MKSEQGLLKLLLLLLLLLPRQRVHEQNLTTWTEGSLLVLVYKGHPYSAHRLMETRVPMKKKMKTKSPQRMMHACTRADGAESLWPQARHLHSNQQMKN